MTALAKFDEELNVSLSPTSLTILGTGLTFQEVEKAVGHALQLGDASRWWLGDLLLFADNNYGESYSQLLNMAAMSERQAERYRYVSEKVAPSLRRENLSFSHHEVVASAEPNMQARLLAMAEAGPLSVAALREAYKDQKTLIGPPPPAPSRIVMDADTTATDAARGLRTARATIRTIATEVPSATETLNLPDAQRGIDAAMKIVQRNSPLEDVLVAVGVVIEQGAVQTGLPDPAVIVPSGPWANLLAAHQRATEGRKP